MLNDKMCILGSELRNWVLYFSLPVLSGILAEPHLSHFAQFVAAIQMLSLVKISRNDIDTAETLLNTFYFKFSDLNLWYAPTCMYTYD